jgi:hypothetical protein
MYAIMNYNLTKGETRNGTFIILDTTHNGSDLRDRWIDNNDTATPDLFKAGQPGTGGETSKENKTKGF